MWQSGKTVSPTAGGACGTDITPTTNLTESPKSAILITATAYVGAAIGLGVGTLYTAVTAFYESFAVEVMYYLNERRFD